MEIYEKAKIIKDAGWKQTIVTTPERSIDPVVHPVFKDPKTGNMKNLDDALAIHKSRNIPAPKHKEKDKHDKNK